MVYRLFVLCVCALLVVPTEMIRGAEPEPPKPTPVGAPEPLVPPPAVPCAQEISASLSVPSPSIEKNTKKKAKKTKKQLWKWFYRVTLVGALVWGVGWVGLPEYWSWRARAAYAAYVLRAENLSSKKMHQMGAEDFEAISVLLMEKMKKEEILSFLLNVDRGEEDLLKEATNAGIPKKALQDPFEWAAYYHANFEKRSVSPLMKLLGVALRVDWKRFKEDLGEEMEDDVTVEHFLHQRVFTWIRR